MLTKLHIKNFKCFEDTGEMKLCPLTVLVGPNSSGKSSLFQMLLALKQTVALILAVPSFLSCLHLPRAN